MSTTRTIEDIQQIAVELRDQQATAAEALLQLNFVEKMRRWPGYEIAPWKYGSYHQTLEHLGLVTVKESEITMTTDGRQVAAALEQLIIEGS